MADENFAQISIDCPACKAKQKVRVTGRTGFSQMAGPQTIRCIRCKKDFEKSIPDRIMGGPFPV
jgi:transposase-like protein